MWGWKVSLVRAAKYLRCGTGLHTSAKSFRGVFAVQISWPCLVPPEIRPREIDQMMCQIGILRTAVWLLVTTIVEYGTSIIVEMNHSDDLWLNYTILTMMGPYYYKREMSASSLSMTFDTTDDIRWIGSVLWLWLWDGIKNKNSITVRASARTQNTLNVNQPRAAIRRCLKTVSIDGASPISQSALFVSCFVGALLERSNKNSNTTNR